MIVVVGTVALDSVETPVGSMAEAPGGSALYFAAAAARFGPVAVVGVTGQDFPQAPLDRLAERGVDLSGLRRAPLPTFRWQARYDGEGRREVLSVHRGGIVKERPEVPAGFRDPGALFLGSTDPAVQAWVLDQAGAPGWVVLDTMAHWIHERRDDLDALLARVDVLLVNEDELALLGRGDDTVASVQARGPAWVVVKRGGRGASAYGAGLRVDVAATPVARVVDPTGAGDAFAGGFVARIAGRPVLTEDDVRGALDAGVEMGGLAVSGFSFGALLDD